MHCELVSLAHKAALHPQPAVVVEPPLLHAGLPSGYLCALEVTLRMLPATGLRCPTTSQCASRAPRSCHSTERDVLPGSPYSDGGWPGDH